jgi:hypothetical protein
MNNLRCPCPHGETVAKYDDKTVEIKTKHGYNVRLTVVEGG